MAEPDLPPVCQAPSCRDEATVRFLWLTPLCARHGAKAHRRAAVNVLVVGVLFTIIGVGLVTIGDLAYPAIGWAVAGCGVVVAASSPFYVLAARRLEVRRL